MDLKEKILFFKWLNIIKLIINFINFENNMLCTRTNLINDTYYKQNYDSYNLYLYSNYYKFIK